MGAREFEAAGPKNAIRDAINFPQYHATYQGPQLRCVLFYGYEKQARNA